MRKLKSSEEKLNYDQQIKLCSLAIWLLILAVHCTAIWTYAGYMAEQGPRLWNYAAVLHGIVAVLCLGCLTALIVLLLRYGRYCSAVRLENWILIGGVLFGLSFFYVTTLRERCWYSDLYPVMRGISVCAIFGPMLHYLNPANYKELFMATEIKGPTPKRRKTIAEACWPAIWVIGTLFVIYVLFFFWG